MAYLLNQVPFQPLNSLDLKLIASTSLAPIAFTSKQMNTTKESISNLFKMWNTALSSFINNKMEHFDALVGENACHIRAAFLTDLLSDNNKDLFKEALKKVIVAIELNIDSLAKILIAPQDRQKSIDEFLIKHHLLFYIPESLFNQVRFIIESYLLTLTKEKMPTTDLILRERTNYRQVDDLGFVHNKTKSLVSNSQKSLSKACCHYIQSEAAHLNNPALPLLLKIQTDAHNRSFLPQFIVAKVLFQRMLQKKQPLVIKITRFVKNTPLDQINLIFKSNAEQSDFIRCNRAPKNEPCIIAAGVINYESIPESEDEYLGRLSQYSMLNILYANFAMHPQYAGELKELVIPFNDTISLIKEQISALEPLKKNELKINSLKNQIKLIKAEQDDFYQKKSDALNNGCALSNPSLLFFNHIYCDMIANHTTFPINYQHLPKDNASKYQSLFRVQ